MHLHSLELIGFKSFADKTLFEFHEGVTAIVGPNGCGKSNVLDAVRWVLGEQSAKALRGGEMADVIFNGTDNRKPVGFGEVSLTFTNCGSELGVDWHDVRVTRRVYRDGNSEYLLNKTICRLRDIQALFADTGVGRSAYSIMEQGKIDLILSSRPEDRRTVFEEAAGITKYKTQKREALRKLEATEANLLRIGDIIKEVKRQIGSLQRQAGKARRYQTLHADLQVLDTHHSRRQLDSLEAEAEQARAEVARLQEAEQDAHGKIEANENDLAAKRRSLDQVDSEIGDARAEVQRLQNELSGLRNRIDFNRQRAQETGELIERYTSDIAAAETKRSEQATQLQEADALIASTNQLLISKEREVEELTETLRRARAERIQKEEELQALQASLSKLENRITSLQTDLTGMKARRDATAARVAELIALVTEATRDLAVTRSKLTAARTAMETERQTAEQRKETVHQAEEGLQHHQAAVATSEKEIGRLEKLIAEKQARLEVLRQMTEEGHGLEKGSQAILKGLDDPERIRPAIAGALVASLNVQPQFVPALEAAFGRNMHAVVLRDPNLAADIFQKLADGKLGQAALAIPGLSSDVQPASSELPQGAIAWAIDKIDAPADVAPLVKNLLRGVAIVPDLATALKLKETARHLELATLGGEFVSAQGIIFGGAPAAATDSMLGRRAIITGLDQEMQAIETERGETMRARDHAAEQVRSAAAILEEARRNHESAQEKSSQTGVEILSAERAVADDERKLAQLETEKSTLEQQVRNADERISELERELQADRQNLEREQGLQVAAEQTRETTRVREEEASEKLNELRLAVATERQRHESLVHHRAPMAAREAELADLVAARRGDIATYQDRLSRLAHESEGAEAQIKDQGFELEQAEQNAAALSDQRSGRLAIVTEQEAQLRALRNSLNHLRDSRGKEEVRQTQLQLRIENLVEHVARRYQVDLREFASDTFAFQKTLSVLTKKRGAVEGGAPATPPSESADAPDSAGSQELAPPSAPQVELGADLEQIIADLTRQLDNMGPVNLEAVHEYDELEERYRFLETQNNDLTAARREVLDVISRINSTTQKLFADTFAQVRINFGEMFSEMFGGGRADLTLQDENDPLNCGIEISAKPPGKQLQAVSLLSGGERTMTAVALLFAIYMVRPSPFCILDEMDAPLDESNINRFIKVLDRFVSQSQFIIITHNKRTIAKADVLYGVTMEERGVSKLVGMRLASEKGADGELRRTSSNGNGNGTKSHETPRQGQFAMAGESEETRRAARS